MLYLVPTPIGNLGDMTFRAVEVLKSVEYILVEDSRVTAKLLSHFGIDKKMKRFHQHNEHRMVEGLIEELESGKDIALVSDAGTPGISDAAFLLVRACKEKGIPMTCLPGAVALIPALVCSGFPTDRFVFEGFLPHKKGRQKKLLALKEEPRTIVFYESPHRIMKLLDEVAEHLGEDRLISVSREISKLYEEHLQGSASELKAHFTTHAPKGEFVVAIAPAE